jgi:hypothetical protein
MGLREYARHRAELGLSGTTHQAVREAIRSGRLVRAIAGGKINAAIADEEWKGATLEDRVPITGPAARKPRDDDDLPDGIPALHESRARREAAEAALAEIELAEKRGELVLAGDVEARLVNVFSSCKKKLDLDAIIARAMGAWRPPPRLSLSEWADRVLRAQRRDRGAAGPVAHAAVPARDPRRDHRPERSMVA